MGSKREAEKAFQTSKWPLSNSWEIGAGTQIKHIQRFGEESHSFNSWQGESRGDCCTERKVTCKFPIQKSSRTHLNPLNHTPLMATNTLLHLSFLSHSTRFKKIISKESYLFNPFNLFKYIFCVCYSVLIFRSMGLNLYCRRAWSVSFQFHFIEGEKPPKFKLLK